MLATIFWDFPNHIPLGGFELRYYSLMFIISFVLGQYGMQYVFKKENINPKLMDSLVYWMVGATIVGARLGHVFFYDWSYYRTHLSEIPMVWKGGLASHGAAVAIILAMIYWSRKIAKKHPLWTLDRIVIVVALAAGFIRIGNWFNSEIYGAPANSAFETVFLEDARGTLERGYAGRLKSVEFTPTDETIQTDSLDLPVLNAVFTFYQSGSNETESFVRTYVQSILSSQRTDNQNIIIPNLDGLTTFEDEQGWHTQIQVLGIPRYPTQLFETTAYWLIFVLLAWLYLFKNAGKQQGMLFGTFLTLLFGFRFFIEFYKEIQVGFESGMSLNMGQWLSIPLVMIGLLFIINSRKSLNG